METPTKICPECKGKGWKKSGSGMRFQNKLIYIPDYRPCKNCASDGYVYLTLDEIQERHEDNLDREADLREDD